MTDAILAFNAGSSSLKFALFEPGKMLRIVQGEIGQINTAPRLLIRDTAKRPLLDQRWVQPMNQQDMLDALLDALLGWLQDNLGNRRLVAAGHRIVHGGQHFFDPTYLNEATLAALDLLTPLAPLHQPCSLAPVRALAKLRPGLPQIGCFDTAFHRTMPQLAARFALPRILEKKGIRRYGFHGLSYEYIAGVLRRTEPALAGGKIVVAHLGSGASLCGMQNGQSCDTSMGFTALDGLVMATRCGTLDPGAILYLLGAERMELKTVEDLLYRRSGLLGVSGISGDMRQLLASPDSRAAEAVNLFIFQISRQIGALAATLKGIDALVFTAGIGENSAEIRRRVCQEAAWLGISLDATANENGARRISAPASVTTVLTIPTDEESVIAGHVTALIRA